MPRHSLGRFLSDLDSCVCFALCLAIVFTLLPYTDSDTYFVDIISHFRLQYALAGPLAGIWLLFRRRYLWACLGLVCLLLSIPPLLPYYRSLPPAPAASSQNIKTVLVMNVLTRNLEKEAVVRLVREVNPDILVGIEIDEPWKAALESSGIPNTVFVPRTDNFGMGVLTKLPMVSSECRRWHDDLPPLCRAEIDWQGQHVALLGIHTIPPRSLDGLKRRDRQLEVMKHYLSKETMPILALGDLNTSMWSPAFRKFLSGGKLLDTRLGFGVIPTWPSMVPFLQVPLDHALLSSEFQVLEIRRVEIPGSDHLGLALKVALKSSKVNTHSPAPPAKFSP